MSRYDEDFFDEDFPNRRKRRRSARDDDYLDYEEDGSDYDPRYAEVHHRGGSRFKRWILYLLLIFIGLPLLCCGGLLVWSTSIKDFALSNGEHLGGGAIITANAGRRF